MKLLLCMFTLLCVMLAGSGDIEAQARAAPRPVTSTSPQSASSTNSAPGPAAWFGLALDCGECNDLYDRSSFIAPAVVTRVWEGGPAHKAGIAAGDTIVAVDSQQVTARQFRSRLASALPNQVLRLTVGRAAGRVPIELTARYTPTMMVKRDTLSVRYRGAFSGVQVDVLGPSTPIISRDSTGKIMFIRVGDHVIRLTQVP